MPKPSLANRFCMICKEPFDDYLTVIHFLFSISVNPLTTSSFASQSSTKMSLACVRSLDQIPWETLGKKFEKGKNSKVWQQTAGRKVEREEKNQ